MKRILSIVMTLVLLWGLTMPAAAEAAVGTTLRLEKTEGTVTVESASGKSLSLRNGMRLYSGTKIKTSEGSYAYISLDSGKAVKLDASSESEVRKSGKKLELNLLSGELFFDVTVPLEKDESLNIRTSTMVTGVRGTSGYAVVYDCYHSEIVLLEGHLTVHKTHGSTGGSMVEINGGEKAIAAPLREEQNDQIQLTVESVKEESVPGFVAVEVKDDLNLQDRIDKNSPLSVPKIIGDAQQRLEADEKQAAEAAKETQKKLDEQKKEEEKSKPVQVFESSGVQTGGGGGGGGTAPSKPAPEEITLHGNIRSKDLKEALDQAKRVILANDVVLTVDEDVEIPAGKTVTMQSGATATVETGKTMAVTGTMNMENGSSLTNSNNGRFVINSTNSLHLGGTFTNMGGLYVGTKDGSKAGLLELNAGGTLTNRSHVNVYAGSTLRNAGTIDSTGVIAVQGGGSMDNTGTYGMTGGELDFSATASLTNSGTFHMGGGVLNSDGVDLTNSGTFNMKGGTFGTVNLTGAKLVNTGTFNMISGIFKSTTGTALVNQGTATISGGTMSGSGCVIDTSAGKRLTLQGGNVTLEDEAELKPGETELGETKPCVIRGQFTWKDGSLKAKHTDYFPDYKNHGGPAEIENRGNDGYYTATFAGDVRNLTETEFSWLQDALDIPHVKTVNLDLTSSMNLDEDLTIPANKTLNLKNGGLIAPAGKTLTNKGVLSIGGADPDKGDKKAPGYVTVESGATLANAGRIYVSMYSNLTNNGTATIRGGEVLVDGGNLQTAGLQNNGTLLVETNGAITCKGSIANGNTATLTNKGTITLSGRLMNVGTIQNTAGTITLDPSTRAVFQNGPEKPGDRTVGSFENAGTLTIGLGCTFENTGSFTNEGTCTNGGTFNHNGTGSNNEKFINNGEFTGYAAFTNNDAFENGANAVCNVEATFTNNGTFDNNGAKAACNVKAEFVNNEGATFKNGNGAECNLENSKTAVFTNNGTFENGANAACNVGATFTNNGTFENKESATCTINEQTGRFNNDGTFVNKNTGFAPVTNFYTKGTYQENNLRTGLHIMETDSDNKVLQFKPLSAVGSCWTNWTSGTKVTLYGSSTSNSPYDLSTGDAVNFRSIGENVTVTLDLNGQHLDMKDKDIEVAGTLTICDSSEDHNGSIIASEHPPVRVVGGTCTVVQDSITITPPFNSPTEPPATLAAAPAQKSEASLTPAPETGAEEGAKTETGAEVTKPEAKAEEKADAKPETGAEETKPEAKTEEKADAKPEAKTEEKADAKPEEKVEAEAAAAQGTGSEQ